MVNKPAAILSLLAPIGSALVPMFQVSAAGGPTIKVSRDPAALVAKYGDPLVYTGNFAAYGGAAA
eukprot:SM002922S10962  [mRNA]  locus=s2922:1048:1485:- [translate_table: standard]